MVRPVPDAGRPLDPARSRSRVALTDDGIAARGPDPRWRIRLVPETGSTNDDLRSGHSAGTAGTGDVLVAELQTGGRGRRDRTWTSPTGSGLTCSVLIDLADAAANRRPWALTCAALALAEAVESVAEIEAKLKWPNDLQIDGRKAAGLLATTSGTAVVLGMGLNVSSTPDELPGPGATSLAESGAASVDRAALLVATLDALRGLVDGWLAAGGDPHASGILAAYRKRSATLGLGVRVDLEGGRSITGTAADVDDDGRLVVQLDAGGTQACAAGDVVHLRT